MRDPIIVDFFDPEAFCEELQHQSQKAISYGCVRIETIQRPSPVAPQYCSVTVCATAIGAAGQLLLRLRQYAGDLTNLSSDADVRDRVAKTRRMIEAHAEALKLEVLNGVFSTDRGL
jgi:hypothetical protein